MSENISLKVMKCPSCGASLKAASTTEVITCLYCGNSIVPVAEATPFTQNGGMSGGFRGIVRVEGIRSAASALAYMEQFFEEYDWEAFSYAQTLTVAEIDKLAESLKTASADDKNTWLVCFQANAVPYLRKAAGCRQILTAVIEEYRNDSLDAYSKFDVYKRISAMVMAHKADILAKLEKITAKAIQYGATPRETAKLHEDMDRIRQIPVLDVFQDIEQIPQIQAFIQEKNARILQSLAAKGIQAEFAYSRAQELIREKNYVAALNVLLALEGYADSNALIEKIDKYFLLSDVLEIEGNLYCFQNDNDEYSTFRLHSTANGMIADKPLIRYIRKVITNFANILYYLDGGSKLKRFHLSTGLEETICNESINPDAIHVHDRTVFLLANQGGSYGNVVSNILALDLTSGTVRTVVENVSGIVSLTGNKLVYTIAIKIPSDSYEDRYQTITHVMNVDTTEVIVLGPRKVSIEGFLENFVVYTEDSPNAFNKNLYIRPLHAEAPEQLVEQNIFRFCGIIAGKLFYYVGNSRNQTLININCDGTQRKEWPLYIHKVLFEQGGWLYFIRRAGYNSILCRSRLDGSKYSIIAADIEEFLQIKNGYLYYINDVSTLVKVRMDGSNLQELCADVESVLAVREDKIIFVSVDDRISTTFFEQTTTKTVKSIYAVDFSGSGKIKLAYNIKAAKNYDENTVYYVTAQEIKSSNGQPDSVLDMLYRLDVKNYRTERLLVLQAQKEATSGAFGFTMLIFIAVAAFLLAVIGLVSNAAALTVVGLLVGFLCLTFGLVVKLSEKE